MELGSIVSLTVLSVIVVVQQFFYMRQIQLLIDKLMCRSLSEYTSAKTPQAPKMQLPDEYADDGLRTLDEIRGGLM